MIVPSTQHISWVLGAWHHVRSTTAILRRRVYHLYSIAFRWGLEGKYFVHHRSVCSCLAIWIPLTRQQDKEICMLTKSPFLDAHALFISVKQDRDLLGSWDQGKYRSQIPGCYRDGTNAHKSTVQSIHFSKNLTDDAPIHNIYFSPIVFQQNMLSSMYYKDQMGLAIVQRRILMVLLI